MGLKVWLPLNGDLRNLGCSNIEVTNNGATVDSAGKIGSCYYFNASAYLSEGSFNWSNFNTSAFSLCCWYKEPSPVASGNSQMICIGTNSGWNNIRIGLLRRSSSGYPMFSVSDGTNNVNYNCTATTFSLNTWNHIACAYNNGEMKIYLNGILDKTYTTTITPVLNSSQHLGIGSASNGAEKLTGYLNDVRIYDHCLSAAEVKEIAQGLVLHYKLDDIANGVVDSSGYGHNGSINGTLSTSSNTSRYSISTIFNGSDNSIKIPFNDMIKDQNYTISTWIYKTSIGTKSYQTILGGPSGFELEARNSGGSDPVFVAWNWGKNTGTYSFNNWTLFTFVHTSSDNKIYVNGALASTGNAATIPTGDYFIGAWKTATGQNYEGQMSDFRIYSTALSAEDIKSLYNTSMKVDNLGEVHTFELEESGGRELMQGTVITSSYGGSQPFTNYNNGELYFNANSTSAGSVYIPISPTGKTYYWDVDISVNTGNQFYIGFERYDADKTPRANAACVYVVNTKPSSDIVHQRYYGTVNLSTDGVNPCAFIRLRILNGWSGTISGVTGIATVHRLSLREVTTIQKPKIYKDGTFLVDELNEHRKASFYKNGIVEATEFIER